MGKPTLGGMGAMNSEQWCEMISAEKYQAKFSAPGLSLERNPVP